MVRQPLLALDLIYEVSRTDSDTSHSVGFLWTRDRPVPEICTQQKATLILKRNSCSQMNSNPQSHQGVSAEPHLRRRGHRHRSVLNTPH